MPNEHEPSLASIGPREWTAFRIWAAAFALAAIAVIYFGLQSWLLDLQASGRAVRPSRGTFAGSITWLVWAALAPALVVFFRAHPVERPWSIRTVGAYAGAAICAALVHGLIENPLWFWAMNAPPVAHHGPVLRVVWWTLLRTPTTAMQFLAFAAGYHAIALARHARDRELTTFRAQAALAEAELRALKVRLEPHFLFNTLNAIVSCVRHDPAMAEEMIGRLSRLLRGVLQSSATAEVPLSQEIALVREYLELHRVRFGSRLTTAISVDDDVAAALIPSMLLQPLVENAIQHGIGVRPGAGRVSIAARRADTMLAIEVCDESVAQPDAVRAIGGVSEPGGSGGVGLAVTRARLAQRYGPAQRLSLRSSALGTTVRIDIPFRRGFPAS